jgi:hypothetical protein
MKQGSVFHTLAALMLKAVLKRNSSTYGYMKQDAVR